MSFRVPTCQDGFWLLMPTHGAPAPSTCPSHSPFLLSTQGSLSFPSSAGGWLRKGPRSAHYLPQDILEQGMAVACPHSGLVSPKLFQWVLAGTSLSPISSPGTKCLSIQMLNLSGIHSLPGTGTAGLGEGRLTFPPQKLDKCKYARM